MGILTKEFKYTIFNKINLKQLIEIECDSCKIIFFGRYGSFFKKETTYCHKCRQRESEAHKKSRTKNNNPTHIKYWVSLGFSKEEARKKVAFSKPSKEEFYIHKGFSKEEAVQMSRNYERVSYLKPEFYIQKGFSEEEAIEKARCVMEAHTQRAKRPKKRESSRFCIEYWISRGKTEKEAISEVYREQHLVHSKVNRKVSAAKAKITRSLYTQEQLEKLSEIRKKSWDNKEARLASTPIHKEYWIKLGLELNEAKKQAYIAKKQKIESGDLYASRLEKELKEGMFLFLTQEQKKDLKENKFLSLETTHRRYCPDFRIGKRIIEVFGSKIHLDDRFYNLLDKNPWGLPFSEVKKRDSIRISDLEENGYKVLIIWEYDLKNSKEDSIKKIKEFLNNDKD